MKLWLIKLGKALSAIRREGILRGGARVTKSFFALFRRVGSGDILFITGGLGDSALYRSWHVAEELRLNGFRTSVTVQDNPLIPSYVDKFSVFVFHRVMYTPSVAKLIKRAKEQGKGIIFETDDLVFDAEYFKHMDHFRRMNVFERKQYEGGVGAEILADPYVEVCTTTTTFLAEKLAERKKKVFVVPNKLSQSDVEVLNTLFAEREKTSRQDDAVRIGYFSGAKGHDKDFAVVAPVLAELMEKHKNVELLLAGPLDTGEALRPYESRVKRVPYVPRVEHFANVAATDINIAPLEVGNPFCESKSELKFFEAGMLGVSVVASATQTFREAIEDGVDGFVAMTAEDWKEKLERLITDEALRKNMGAQAREKSLQKYTTQNADNQAYYDYLRSRIK